MNNFNLIPWDSIIIKNKSTCWFQPTWKIVVKIGIFPQVGVKRKKNIWNHHLDGPILSSHEHHCFPWRSWPSNEQTNQYPTTRTSVVVSLFRLRCSAAPILGDYIYIYTFTISTIYENIIIHCQHSNLYLYDLHWYDLYSFAITILLFVFLPLLFLRWSFWPSPNHPSHHWAFGTQIVSFTTPWICLSFTMHRSAPIAPPQMEKNTFRYLPWP